MADERLHHYEPDFGCDDQTGHGRKHPRSETAEMRSLFSRLHLVETRGKTHERRDETHNDDNDNPERSDCCSPRCRSPCHPFTVGRSGPPLTSARPTTTFYLSFYRPQRT